MIERGQALAKLRTALRRSRVVVLVGPRQCGKTTLARRIVPPGSPNYFDLEDPVALARLEQPLTALSPLRGTVVLDEVQRRPELFPVLRGLADRRLGVEMKRADAPRLTPSMVAALHDLALEQLVVLYPGPRRYTLHERVSVAPLGEVTGGAEALFPRARTRRRGRGGVAGRSSRVRRVP